MIIRAVDGLQEVLSFMDTHNVLFAFSLSLFAGLATGIGSALTF